MEDTVDINTCIICNNSVTINICNVCNTLGNTIMANCNNILCCDCQIMIKKHRTTKEFLKKWETEEYKMILCVRTDLKMGKGKIAAQCCHAAVSAVLHGDEKVIKHWQERFAVKVALKCPSEELLIKIQMEAIKRGLIANIVIDIGRTQIVPNTKTICAIGPAPRSIIDEITGRYGICPLKLL